MTYSWDKSGSVQPTAAQLPEERTSPRQTMVRIASLMLLIGVAGLGLAITFTSLLTDMKRRRHVIYRPRGS